MLSGIKCLKKFSDGLGLLTEAKIQVQFCYFYTYVAIAFHMHFTEYTY